MEILGIIGVALGLAIGLFVVWLLLGIRIVRPNQMGNKIFFGKIGEAEPKGFWRKLIFGFCDSGLHWAPFLSGCGIIRIPKDRFELSYPPKVVISMAEDSQNEGGTKSFLGKQFLLVEVGIYVEFRRGYIAVKQAIERGSPTTKDGIIDVTDSIVNDAVREAIGSMGWSEATEISGRKKIGEKVLARLKNTENGFLGLMGFDTDKIEVAIGSVNLENKALKEAIADLEKERIQEQSAVLEARRMKTEVDVVGDIRKGLEEKGMSADMADQTAASLYELNVAKDLHIEKGGVLKIIRFGSGVTGKESSSIAKTIAEIMASVAASRDLLESKKEKNQEKTLETEELTQEQRINKTLEALKKLKK